jgi:hypothetical protein
MIGSQDEFPISNKRFQKFFWTEVFCSYKYAKVKQLNCENDLLNQGSFLVV